ncbi:hypothetical protein [Massilia niastensis]|uniref:hypothetical protein n=1 Tax=Massilia niastensis TaxID=544911 RepID=UPI00036F9027|nr:hypothetical protein [Massilia niastensis]
MTATRLATTAAFVLVLSLLGAAAWAADPEEHFLLTPALVQKLKAAGPDIKKLEKLREQEGKEDETDGDVSVDEFARAIEAEPRAKAVLAKHGIGVKEFALSTYAMVHAGMFVALEASMDKQKAAEMMGTFTREQRANIALLRKMGPAAH